MSKCNVRHLKPCSDLATGLRELADSIESGEIDADRATLIMNSEVSQLGIYDDSRAAEQAVFDMVFGISKLMFRVNVELEK